MKSALLLLVLVLLFVSSGSAQTVVIKRVDLVGEKITVTYDLEDSNPTNNYLLNLYTSRDNFAVAVKNVSGDVGLEVKPGAGKKITWNVVQEYGAFKGKLSLEVRGRVYMPFVRFEGITNRKSYKRGKSYEFKWKPGNSNPLSIELFRGGQRISGDINQPNNGSYNLFIPSHAVKGKDYRLKIFDMRSPDEVIYSENFAVTPKVPLLLKIAPVAVVGGVIVLLTRKSPSAGPGDDGVDIEDPSFPTN